MPLLHIEGAEWPSWRGHGQWASTRAARGCARGPPMTTANGGRPACGPPRRTSSKSRSGRSGGDGECAAPTSRGSSSPPAECGLGPRVIRLARSGNVTARLVVGAEAAALAWTLARVAGALRLEGETAASWAGSLMGDDYFRAQVWRWARRQGLRVTPRAPRESALDAAARLAAARGR